MAEKGVKQSAEHIAKRMAAWRLSPGLEKAKERLTALNKSRAGIPLSIETKEKQSLAMMGKQNSLGCKRSEEFKRNLSEYWKENIKDHNFYVDGKGEERGVYRKYDMARLDYKLWRKKVFERDNYTCQECGKSDCEIHADHIKPYSVYAELRYSVENGRTLCVTCHRKTNTFGVRKKKNSAKCS